MKQVITDSQSYIGVEDVTDTNILVARVLNELKFVGVVQYVSDAGCYRLMKGTGLDRFEGDFQSIDELIGHFTGLKFFVL